MALLRFVVKMSSSLEVIDAVLDTAWFLDLAFPFLGPWGDSDKAKALWLRLSFVRSTCQMRP